MPKGYILAEVEVTDAALYEQYVAMVGATVARYGGRFVVRGGNAARLEGDRPTQRMVILEFDSPERASEWYNSEQVRTSKGTAAALGQHGNGAADRN